MNLFNTKYCKANFVLLPTDSVDVLLYFRAILALACPSNSLLNGKIGECLYLVAPVDHHGNEGLYGIKAIILWGPF
jgi:hypothetical protein